MKGIFSKNQKANIYGCKKTTMSKGSRINQQDLAISLAIEHQFTELLQQKGYTVSNTEHKGVFPGYDLVATNPQNGQVTKLEIKRDVAAASTGNICLECYKWLGNKKEPSGLTKTNAKYYVYSIPGDQNWYIIETATIVELLQDKNNYRLVRGGDDGIYQLALFDKDLFFLHCDKYPGLSAN